MKSTLLLLLVFAATADAALTLQINDTDYDVIALKTGQSVTVQVISDDAAAYTAYIGFDDASSTLGSFTHLATLKAAGNLASVSVSSPPLVEGFYVSAAGTLPPPSAGIHFTFTYAPATVGNTTLYLYDSDAATLLQKIGITVEPAELGSSFTYQGRLIEDNEAMDAAYDFKFRLYDAPTEGIQLGSTNGVDDLEVISGYFTVELDFGASPYDGDNVWLEVSVRDGDSTGAYTVLTPRQRLTATPYASYAAASNWNSLANVPADIADGDDDTHLTESQVETYIANDLTTGSVPYSNESTLANTPLLYALNYDTMRLGGSASSSRRFSVYTNAHNYGIRTETANTSGNNFAIYGTATGDTAGYSYGVYGRSGSEGGGNNYGMYGSASAATAGENYGVYGAADDSSSYNYGLFGVASSSDGSNYGVYGYTSSSSTGNNYGVYGYGSNNGTGNAWAGYFNGDVQLTGILNAGYDLRMATEDEAKVAIGDGIDDNHKLHVYTATDVCAGYFSNTNSSGLQRAAIVGENTGDAGGGYGYGVYGSSSSDSGQNYGVFGQAVGDTSSPSYGLYGTSSSNGGGNNYGVRGSAANATSGDNYGVYGYAYNSGSGDAWAGYFEGDVYVTGIMSAQMVIDRTPYPKDLATAYEAVESMQRLPEGQYDVSDMEMQLDHSLLSDFIRSEDGHRDLSATVSCHNEVLKDLIKKQDRLTLANRQIEQLQQQVQQLQEQNRQMHEENQQMQNRLDSIETRLTNLSAQDILK